LEVKDYYDTRLIASSSDDAAGEAFDKAARVLGLPYPGGPEIEKLAKQGTANIKMPIPLSEKDGLIKFSYSGLKTFVINHVHTAQQKGLLVNKADVAASFQHAAVEQLVEGMKKASKATGMKKFAIAGGVSANSHLRTRFTELSKELNAELYYPPLAYCTDNAAMIGSAAYFMAKCGIKPSPLSLDASATVPLTSILYI
jgi:N6-L-threonylcarbamoyladenine synthase